MRCDAMQSGERASHRVERRGVASHRIAFPYMSWHIVPNCTVLFSALCLCCVWIRLGSGNSPSDTLWRVVLLRRVASRRVAFHPIASHFDILFLAAWPSDGRAGLSIALLFSSLGAGVLRGQAWAGRLEYRSSLLWAPACCVAKRRAGRSDYRSLDISLPCHATPCHTQHAMPCHAMQNVEAAQEQRADGEL
jgi:hypothetical protein